MLLTIQHHHRWTNTLMLLTIQHHHRWTNTLMLLTIQHHHRWTNTLLLFLTTLHHHSWTNSLDALFNHSTLSQVDQYLDVLNPYIIIGGPIP